jgi:hypothetical protein
VIGEARIGASVPNARTMKRVPSRHSPSTEGRVEAWMPDYETFGYSRRDAEQLVRIAERLWGRYTALGLTIDSTNPTPTALDPFEVLVQASWHFGVRRLFSDVRRPGW